MIVGMFVYNQMTQNFWFTMGRSGNLMEYHLIGVVSFSLLILGNVPDICYGSNRVYVFTCYDYIKLNFFIY